MEVLANYITKTEEVEEKQRILVEELHFIIEQIVRKFHPYEINDVVKGNSWAFRGKPMVIKKRSMLKAYKEWFWVAEGPVITTGGYKGRNICKWRAKVDLKMVKGE